MTQKQAYEQIRAIPNTIINLALSELWNGTKYKMGSGRGKVVFVPDWRPDSELSDSKQVYLMDFCGVAEHMRELESRIKEDYQRIQYADLIISVVGEFKREPLSHLAAFELITLKPRVRAECYYWMLNFGPIAKDNIAGLHADVIKAAVAEPKKFSKDVAAWAATIQTKINTKNDTTTRAKRKSRDRADSVRG